LAPFDDSNLIIGEDAAGYKKVGKTRVVGCRAFTTLAHLLIGCASSGGRHIVIAAAGLDVVPIFGMTVVT
jgi:hypothetical protein